MFAFFDTFIAGFAATFVWVLASQLHTPIIRPIQRWFRRGWRRPLISCPWCSGFYLSIILVISLQIHRLDWIVTPITILAATALVGLVGSNFTPGIEDEDNDE